MVKLNHYWTINPIRRSEYGKFIVDEFIPEINRLGMHTVAGWSVLVGGYSEIMFESVAGDLELLEKALRDPGYDKIKTSLLGYVKQYKTKVLVPTGKKVCYTTDIPEDMVKLTQMWDVLSEKKDDYERFILEEFYPVLEELGIRVACEWDVLIGDGPRILCEGRAAEAGNLIPSLRSDKFLNARRRLKDYVENYESRILSYHIRKITGYKSVSYHVVSDCLSSGIA